ncbi:MAG: response regulator [Leptolyngbyaceae cyanobacterium MO_188.B28]|nr:response regulator [Leptolyngbyaceae cyanobacterium MO_188.B28]
MHSAEDLLTFSEKLVKDKTGNDLSDLQRLLLLAILQGVKKSYEDLAEDYNYSPRYLRQDIAPKLWQLMSEALACKVSKTNVRAILERQMQNQDTEAAPSPSALSASPPHPSSPDPKKRKIDDVQAGKTADFEKGKILLVDDKLENLALLTHLLEEEGYKVQQAINGVVALRVTASTLPDLILLDIHMPELDGYSVCQTLRDNPKTQHIPIIFVSALNESWDKVKAFSVGGNDFITKPFKTIEVLARVQNQLKFRRLQQALQERERQLQEALQTIETLRAEIVGLGSRLPTPRGLTTP